MDNKALFLPLAALCLSGCVNVVTDASTTSVSSAQTTNVEQVQAVNGTEAGAVQSTGSIEANSVTEFSPDELLQKVISSKRPFATGWSASTGIWMISRQKIKLKDNMSDQEAMNIAEVKAKKKIAEFMGSDVTAQDSAFMSVSKEDGKTQYKKSISSFSSTSTNQFLRGVTLLHAEKKGDCLFASFYVTSKMIDATQQMERELRKAPPGMVQTSGYAIIVDNRIPPAKQAALQLALRNAIEQVMGTTVVGQSSLMNNEKVKSKIISQTMGTIKSYRIVKEGVSGINYQVIAVSEVDKDSLLKNYTSLVRSMGNPGFFINTEDPDLRTALSGFMRDLGFKVSANSADSHFIVDAGCNYLEVTDEHYGKGIQIDVALKLFDAKTNQQLFFVQNNPRFTSTYSGSFHQIRQMAAKRAFKTMKREMHEKLNKVVMDWVLNGREVNVVFFDLPDNSLDSTLASLVNDVPCAKFQTMERDGDKLVLHCSYVGPSADLEDFLRESMKAGLPQGRALPKTQKIELNTIEFRF